LKHGLKKFRNPNDVEGLAALYDAHKAAAEAILAIQNQPRATPVDELLEHEWCALMEKAWTVAEHLKGLRPTKWSQKAYLRVIVDSAFDLGANLDDATAIQRDARAIGVADDREHDAKRGA
jgi:hypothetical protein